jgi:antitoxin MazE
VADQVPLVEGTTVELEVQDGALKITPTRKKFTLAELLENEPKRPAGSTSAEVDWGKLKGDEVW